MRKPEFRQGVLARGCSLLQCLALLLRASTATIAPEVLEKIGIALECRQRSSAREERRRTSCAQISKLWSELLVSLSSLLS